MAVTKSSTRPIRVRMLGALSVTCGEDRQLTQPRRLALFIYLLLAEPRGLHSRETVMALLWPDSAAEQARQALRNSLHAIRRTLGDDVVVTAGNDAIGVNQDMIATDLDELLAILGADDAALPPAGRFDLFTGFNVTGAPDFERWLDVKRSTLSSAVTGTLLARARAHQARGDRGLAAAFARAAHAADPDDEPILRACVELVAADGDVAGALRLYRDFSERLSSDFDAEPAAETTAIIVGLTAQRSKRGSADVWRASSYYVRGTYLFLRAAHVGGSEQDLHESRGFFERALEVDPDFALAHAGLSNYYAVCAARGILRPFAEHFGRTIALSHEALALDPTLAIPHVHFGVQAMYLDSDWARAGTELRHAVELDPHYAEARRLLGVYHGAMGAHEQAIAELREAVQLEPHTAINRNSLGDALMTVGRYAEAAAELRECLRAHPDSTAASNRLLRCLERDGLFPAAVDQRKARGGSDAERFAEAFSREGAAGYRRERQRELRGEIDGLERRLAVTDDPANLFTPLELQLALAYAELGEMESARLCETRAAAVRPGRRQWFVSRPELRVE